MDTGGAGGAQPPQPSELEKGRPGVVLRIKAPGARLPSRSASQAGRDSKVLAVFSSSGGHENGDDDDDDDDGGGGGGGNGNGSTAKRRRGTPKRKAAQKATSGVDAAVRVASPVSALAPPPAPAPPADDGAACVLGRLDAPLGPAVDAAHGRWLVPVGGGWAVAVSLQHLGLPRDRGAASAADAADLLNLGCDGRARELVAMALRLERTGEGAAVAEGPTQRRKRLRIDGAEPTAEPTAVAAPEAAASERPRWELLGGRVGVTVGEGQGAVVLEVAARPAVSVVGRGVGVGGHGEAAPWLQSLPVLLDDLDALASGRPPPRDPHPPRAWSLLAAGRHRCAPAAALDAGNGAAWLLPAPGLVLALRRSLGAAASALASVAPSAAWCEPRPAGAASSRTAGVWVAWSRATEAPALVLVAEAGSVALLVDGMLLPHPALADTDA